MKSRLSRTLLRGAKGCAALVRTMANAVEEAFDEELQGGRCPTVRRLGSRGVHIDFAATVHIDRPERMHVGNYVYANHGCVFRAHGGLQVEDYVVFGVDVLVMTAMHRYRDARLLPYDEVDLLRPVNIGRGSWIGTRSIILPGVELGESCIVGVGSVVTRSYPEGTILGGNPARPIGKRDAEHWKALAAQELYWGREKIIHNLTKREVFDDSTRTGKST